MAEHIVGKIIKIFGKGQKSDGWFSGVICFGDGTRDRIAGTASSKIWPGCMVECDAEHVRNSKYGWQWIPVRRGFITRVLTSREDVISFLSGSAFPGIGTKTAERIYDRYGRDTMMKLKSTPGDCAEECGLNPVQTESLLAGISGSRTVPDLMAMMPHLSAAGAKRIADKQPSLGADLLFAEIKADPYGTLRKRYGLSFRDADETAVEDFDIGRMSRIRLENIITEALGSFMAETNSSYVRLSDFVEWNGFFERYVKNVRIYESLPVYDGIYFCDGGWLAAKIAEWDEIGALDLLTVAGPRDAGGIQETVLYRKTVYDAENFLTNFLTAPDFPEEDMSVVRSTYGWNALSKKQQDAVEGIYRHRVSFISGGPGRGKTTALSTFVKSWSGAVVLLAPTGRAVNRLKIQTGMKAETVARFLERNGKRKSGAEVTDVNNLTVKNNSGTVVVIDEASMLGLEDAANVAGMLPGARYVFVGDTDQLPAIQAGPFLQECAEIADDFPDMVHMTRLTENFRTDRAELNGNADVIRTGGGITDLKMSLSFMILPCSEDVSDGEALSPAEKYITDTYEDYLAKGATFTDILVMTPFSNPKYRLSSPNLNRALQNALNPVRNIPERLCFPAEDDRGPYCMSKGVFVNAFDDNDNEIRIGDRIMNLKNDMGLKTYVFRNDNAFFTDDLTETDRGVFNGDSGTVVRSYGNDVQGRISLLVRLDGSEGEDGRYVIIRSEDGWHDGRNAQIFKNWSLGYAVSIHKAQGCEADHVIIAMSEQGRKACEWRISMGGNPFLIRNMLYTAVTRAKKDVLIVGSIQAVGDSMRNGYRRGNMYLAVAVKERFGKEGG